MVEAIHVLKVENDIFCKELDRLRNETNLQKSVNEHGELVMENSDNLMCESR